MKSFLYFYVLKPLPEKIRDAAPDHARYWKSRQLAGYLGGPFADRTGGLILFEAVDAGGATDLADADPFVTGALIETRWVKEWSPE